MLNPVERIKDIYPSFLANTSKDVVPFYMCTHKGIKIGEVRDTQKGLRYVPESKDLIHPNA